MLNIVFLIESLQCGGAEKSLTTLLQNFNFKKLMNYYFLAFIQTF